MARRPLLGCLLLCGFCALSPSFVGPLDRRPRQPQKPQMQGTRAEVEPLTDEEDGDPMAKFMDRWSTNGGLLLGSILGIGLGLGLEKFFELFMDWTKAGMAVTGVYSAGLIIWLSQYLWRVENKQTTYAKQLSQYEQEIMIRRLSELSEEEIDALCFEVGIDSKEVSAALEGDDRIKELSKKEQILELFRNTEMKPQMDPRAGLPFFQ
ncbi:unnamed protein product [Effrenium voratum]|nr:unnamed protein product [Effrenium voratum]